MTKTLTFVTVLLLSLAGYSAAADAYSASVNSCRNAIGDKLGISDVPATYDIQKVKTKARYRDIRFSVSAFDKNNPLQNVEVKCRSKRSGEILAVEFNPNTLPHSIAIK